MNGSPSRWNPRHGSDRTGTQPQADGIYKVLIGMRHLGRGGAKAESRKNRVMAIAWHQSRAGGRPDGADAAAAAKFPP
jgi:hypothetical protein